MKITAKEFVESLAQMSDEEKQKAANLLVNKWFHLTQLLVFYSDFDDMQMFQDQMV